MSEFFSSDSLLKRLPSSNEVREQIIRNSEENRQLRSLYKLCRRIEEAKESHEQEEKKAAEQGSKD